MLARTGGSAGPREADYAARLARGEWRGATLRTERGDTYTLLYEGRRGGPAGPDYRDAVLVRAGGARVCGDVELHLPTGGWAAHGHDRDPRYSGVVLHVVVRPPRAAPDQEVALAGGGRAPTLRLDTIAPRACEASRHGWPCERLAGQLGQRTLRALLRDAGARRCMVCAEELAGALRMARMAEDEKEHAAGLRRTPVDRMLWSALAEGLGYGRDRAALRACGDRIAANAPPDLLLAEALRLPRVEGMRVRGLVELARRCETCGPWPLLEAALTTGPPDQAYTAVERLLSVKDGAISRGRRRSWQPTWCCRSPWRWPRC